MVSQNGKRLEKVKSIDFTMDYIFKEKPVKVFVSIFKNVSLLSILRNLAYIGTL